MFKIIQARKKFYVKEQKSYFYSTPNAKQPCITELIKEK